MTISASVLHKATWSDLELHERSPRNHTSDSSGRMCVKNNLRSCHFIFATCSRRFVTKRKPVNLINFTPFFCLLSHVSGTHQVDFRFCWVVSRLTGKFSFPRKLKPANKERQSILVQLNALLITFVGILYIIVLCHTRRFCRLSSQGRGSKADDTQLSTVW